MQWTEDEDDVLRECSYRGAAYAAGEIWRRLGIRRSVHAVEHRASRIHCSLAVLSECPECGAVGVQINQGTGMCRKCSELFHLEEEKAFNELLEAERAAAEDGAEVDALKRARDMWRKRNSRLCRDHGLKTRRERKKEERR